MKSLNVTTWYISDLDEKLKAAFVLNLPNILQRYENILNCDITIQRKFNFVNSCLESFIEEYSEKYTRKKFRILLSFLFGMWKDYKYLVKLRKFPIKV